MNPATKSVPPLIPRLTKESADTSACWMSLLPIRWAKRARRRHRIIIDDAAEVKLTDEESDAAKKENRRDAGDAYSFNWSILLHRSSCRLSRRMKNMANLNQKFEPSWKAEILAADLRRAFRYVAGT